MYRAEWDVSRSRFMLIFPRRWWDEARVAHSGLLHIGSRSSVAPLQLLDDYPGTSILGTSRWEPYPRLRQSTQQGTSRSEWR